VGVTNKIINIKIEEFDSENDLTQDEKTLLSQARQVRDTAYAPYSDFFVGAALLMDNGEVVTGSNQENAAYPSGLCAERVAIFYAGSRFPNIGIKTLVISCKALDFKLSQPISPCGACRQAIAEYETRQNKKIRIIMSGDGGKVQATEGIENLLPLMFRGGDFLK
jgi:cytidine deaminase